MRVALLLAAGRSRRFTGGNKLLANYRGRPIVAHAVVAARSAPVGRVIVVVGHDAARVAAAVRGPRTTIVRASDYGTGVAASLCAGLRALRPAERHVFVFLGDMPFVPPHLARRISHRLRPEMLAVRPCGRAGPAHPVLLRRPDNNKINALRGDTGLSALIAGWTGRVPISGRVEVDVDTRHDLARRR